MLAYPIWNIFQKHVLYNVINDAYPQHKIEVFH